MLEVSLDTGRSHQIRAHLGAIGHPIVGDRRYGDRALSPFGDSRRIALHARRVAFDHPIAGHRVTVEAPLPEDMRALGG